MERSEKEREAARIERERRRAERAGSGPVASQDGTGGTGVGG